jgi:hypothetical protein
LPTRRGGVIGVVYKASKGAADAPFGKGKGNDMSMKIRALGLGVLAVLAIGTTTSINASASVTGHFTHTASDGHATLTGTEGPGNVHRVRFSVDNGTHIECNVAHYHGTVTVATVTTIDLTPTYSGCHTEGEAPGSITIDTNNCHLRFHSNSNASTHNPSEHATLGYVCPAGVAGISITHPNCTIRMPTQPLKGVVYTTTEENSRHTLTVTMTVQGKTAHYESGICIFLGTTHSGATTGSFTLEAFNTAGERVHLTAT